MGYIRNEREYAQNRICWEGKEMKKENKTKIISVCCKCKGEGHFKKAIFRPCPFCGNKSWIYYRIKNGKRILRGAKVA